MAAAGFQKLEALEPREIRRIIVAGYQLRCKISAASGLEAAVLGVQI